MLLTLLAGLLLAPQSAIAQHRPGIRTGVSGDPGQFYFGGHIETDPLLDRLSLRPNIEIGLGGDLTLIALNIEFAYRIPLKSNPWTLYLGGGPAINIFETDDTRFEADDTRRGRGGESGLGGGFNILVGVEHPQGLFTELKIGAIDSPDLKFSVGYSFR